MLLWRQISVYKHFSDVGKVCKNTSPVPERCMQILPRLLRRRRSVSKYFSGAGEVFLYIYLSDTSPAPEKPVKYLYTPFRHRRSIYTHFSGTGEVFIYTCRAQEKPKKYLYTPFSAISISLSISFWPLGVNFAVRSQPYLSHWCCFD